MAARFKRRRRVATAAACALAAGAFSLGAVLAGGTEPRALAGRAVVPVGPGWRDLAARLPAGRLAGQRIVVGMEGTSVPPRLRRLLASGGAAGVVLFGDNLPSRADARRLTRELRAIPRPPGAGGPPLVMVDQEGGEVKRLDGPPAGSAAEMGERGRAHARRQGRLTGRSLAGLGIGVDLAPVLAVGRPGSEMVETERAWGPTPRRVAATAVPFAAGLRAAGVAATAKHFPGLGAVRGDTDVEVERIHLPVETLRRVDEAPYRRFAAAGGEMVMMSLAIYPALSPLPAAFARPIATGELRGRLGFAGVSATDSLDAASARSVGGPARAGLLTARAGVDLLLYTGTDSATGVRRALVRGLRSGRLGRDGFERSVARVLRLRGRLAR